MKMNTVGIVTPINKDDMKELLKETKETLATNVLLNNSSTFSELNMWKMRRNARPSTALRRRYL
jgi:hypothetical protein